MNIGKIKNNNINFKSSAFPAFDNVSVYFQRPQNNDAFVSRTVQPDNSLQKNELTTEANILIAGLTLAGAALAYIGTKRFIKKPSKADIALTQFLDNKANELSNLTETLKSNVKILYEKHLGEFKKLFAIPDSKLPQNIQNTVLELENAKSVQELFAIEDKAITGIYEWFRSASQQQKPASEFVKSYNKFKEELSTGVKQLQEETVSELEKPLGIPENLKKTKHSKQILQKFNNEILNHEKHKVERLSDYVDKLADEDAIALFEKYNEGYDRLLSTKNTALNKLIKYAKTIKERISGKETSVTTKNITSVLPDSIQNNDFFKFITTGEKNKQQWSDFISNKLGKDLSYKDIEILEKRLMLRKGITVNDEIIKNYGEGKANLQEIFAQLAGQNPLKKLDVNKINAEQYVDLVDMANSIKSKYGLNSLIMTEMELKNAPRVDNNSLIFKINSAINVYKKQMEMFYKTDRNNYFNWEEIL